MTEPWIKDYFEKIGVGDAFKLFLNSPEKKPDEFDIEQAANDFLADKENLYKSSEGFKTSLKDASIVALKNYKKQINAELGLGLSSEEAGKIDPVDFLGKVKGEIESRIEASKNGKSSEWQEKYNTISNEFNGFKKKYDDEISSWAKKYEESETRFVKMKESDELNKVFESNFSKFNWGSDEIQKKNAKRIITAELQERGIKFRPDGTIFTGENDVVKSKDSHTVIKDISSLLSEIGNENKLIQQANRGQENGSGFRPSGNDEADKVAQAALARIEKLNSGN